MNNLNLRFRQNSFPLLWKAFLCAFAYILGAFHILFAAFGYVVPFESIASREYWVAISLLLISVLTLIISFIVFPRSRYSIRHVLKKSISYEQLFVIAVPIWCFISCVVRQNIEKLPYIQAMKWEILFTGIIAFILFPMARFVGLKKSAILIEPILHIIVITYTAFTLLALYYAFHLEDLILPSGNEAGLTNKMQLVLGTHYNMTGAISCMMLCLSLYMIFTQKPLLRIIYFAISLIHLLVVILSNSRTAFIGTLSALFCATFCFTWCSLMNKKRLFSPLLRILLCILSSLFIGFLFWVLRPLVISGFDQITGFSEGVKASAQVSRIHLNTFLPTQLSTSTYSSSLLPSPLAVSARKITADLNGRLDIWRAGLKVIFSSPVSFFFGVTPVRITEQLMKIGGLTEAFYGTHNAFLDVGVEFGLPAMLAFIAFAVKIVIRCFRILLCTKREEFKKIFMIPLTVFILFILNLTEGYLVAYFCVQSYIFFLFCGWVVILDEACCRMNIPRLNIACPEIREKP